MSEPLLQVEDLSKHFPVRAALLGPRAGHREGGGRGELRRAARRDARPGGRERLRQEHPGPHAAAPGGAHGRLIRFDGKDVSRSAGELRGAPARMQLVFQDPYASLTRA